MSGARQSTPLPRSQVRNGAQLQLAEMIPMLSSVAACMCSLVSRADLAFRKQRNVTDAIALLADHRSHALSGHPLLRTLGMELRINASAVFDFSGCAGLRAMNLTLWKVSGKLQLSLCSSNSSRCYDAAAASHIIQHGGTTVTSQALA